MKKLCIKFVNFICKSFDMETIEQTSNQASNQPSNQPSIQVSEHTLEHISKIVDSVYVIDKEERDRIINLVASKVAEFEHNNRIVTSMRMNERMLKHVQECFRDLFDFNTHRELLNRNIIGTLYGIQVIRDENITDNEIVCSDENFTVTVNNDRFIGIEHGISGYSGHSGISGYSGTTMTGISGYSGVRGMSGVSSYTGISGYSGYSGYAGISDTLDESEDEDEDESNDQELQDVSIKCQLNKFDIMLHDIVDESLVFDDDNKIDKIIDDHDNDKDDEIDDE